MGKLIIDLISDTHNRHDRCACEGGDILMHAGDATGHGETNEIVEFLDWFSEQDYKHLIMIPGNHDFGFEKGPTECRTMCEARGITLLNDSGVTVEGVNIWGSPVQPWFHKWAFNRHRGADIKKHWDLIPGDTEILITHGPPRGIMDMTGNGEPVGCDDLLVKLSETDIKLHVFGHIHEARGIQYDGQRTYVNAAFLNRMYCPQAKRPIRATREVVQDGSVVYLAEE
jgi:Icc-related predicted phosphoesterase